MKKKNSVFIATSLDGYIADQDGAIDWLHEIPHPEGSDMGYKEFTSQIDALVMGRKTFDTVCSFDIDWPYDKPVFVVSNTLSVIPQKAESKAHLVNGTLNQVLDKIHRQGYFLLYVDGGTTIQNFLQEDLIDEMVITVIPVLLGGGIRLFGDLAERRTFECTHSELFSNKVVQNHFRRVRKD